MIKTMASYRRWGAAGGGGSPLPGRGFGSYHVFGIFIAKPVAWLIAATLLVSAGGMLLQRNAVPVLTYLVLTAPEVWHGEVWRLVPWVLVEPQPLALIFGCLILYFIGADLARAWGARRFIVLYFAGAAVVGALTCLVARFSTDVALATHVGMWPMQEALIIAWASLFPDRRILAYFVLPLGGRNLIVFTVAGTLIFAMIGGFAQFVPHFLAELLALLYMDVLSVRRLYLRGRMAMLQRDYKRRTAHLKMVDRDEEKPPRWMH